MIAKWEKATYKDPHKCMWKFIWFILHVLQPLPIRLTTTTTTTTNHGALAYSMLKHMPKNQIENETSPCLIMVIGSARLLVS
jgi:hypothetical protein